MRRRHGRDARPNMSRAGAPARRARSSAIRRRRRDRRRRASATRPRRGGIGWPTSAMARRGRATSSPPRSTPRSSASSTRRRARTARRRSASRSCCARPATASAPPRAGPRRRRIARPPHATASGPPRTAGRRRSTGPPPPRSSRWRASTRSLERCVRRVGLGAIQRELDRTQPHRRAAGRGVRRRRRAQAVNDTQGHARRRRAAARRSPRSIMQHLRSYDVIVRFGGDEFVCSLSGQDVAGCATRFDQIAAHLAASADGATFTVGLAERQPERHARRADPPRRRGDDRSGRMRR